MTIGSELREAREQRGISLREIAERTNIRLPVLRAIENDDFRALPGSVIMRGFLKLYAREVGLDPDDIGRRYTAQSSSRQIRRRGQSHETAARRPRRNRDGTIRFNRLERGHRRRGARADGRWLLPSSVTLRRRAVTADRPSDSPPPADDTRRTPNREASPPPEPRRPAAVRHRATAAPDPPRTQPCRRHQRTGSHRPPGRPTRAGLRPPPTDEQVSYRVLTAGERLAGPATREAILRIGIPANVTVTIDDQPIRPFARPGTPTTLTITPANFRDLLAR